MKHPKAERLSAFLEGDLPPEEVRDLERHVDGCDRCGGLLRDLRQIQTLARDLPERHPPRDLWPGIADSIRRAEAREPEIIRLFPGDETPERRKRPSFRVSVPQAVAAGLALALLSGAAGARMAQAPTPDPQTASAPSVSWVSLVREASPGLEGSALEVARLEEIFAGQREELDPETVKILEKNLRVIDRAIQESVEALGSDPGNRFLEDHLERSILAKGEYLRDAALLIQPLT